MSTSEGTPFCPRCGALNEVQAQFCFRCGSRLDRPAAPAPAVAPPPPAVAAPPPAVAPPPSPYAPPPSGYASPPPNPFDLPHSYDPASAATTALPAITPARPDAVRPDAGRRRRNRVALVAAAVVVLLAAGVVAAIALTGNGHKKTPAAASTNSAPAPLPSASSTPDFPSQPTPSGEVTATAPASNTGAAVVSSEPAPSASAGPAEPTGPVPGPTTVAGDDGNAYAMRIYAADSLDDCAAHSYGTSARRFLQENPCQAAHRLIAITRLGSRRLALSIITVDFAGDPYTAARFVDLERAPGTGGMNDLLREGHRMPGVASHIPSTEAFSVRRSGSTVAVLDAWWLRGHTADHEADLVALEDALFPSTLTPRD